jgi:hypothetical protein
MAAPEKNSCREVSEVFPEVYSFVLFKQKLNIASDRRTT